MPREWRERWELIPGYDPERDAEGYRFDASVALDAIAFFRECLTHVKGKLAGQPLILERWQEAIVGALFGWLSLSDGLRRYREAFVFVPKKNGKTTLAAGLAAKLLYADRELGAEVYSAAAAKDQAAILYGILKTMVTREPFLRTRSKIYRSFKSIEVAETQSVYRALAAIADLVDGLNVHGAICDELHRWADRELYDVLEMSTASRAQPLIVSITTADYFRVSICNEKYEYATKVRDGIVRDARFLPAIWEAAIEDDWTDPATWRKANPNFGVSVTEEYFRAKCAKALASPTIENAFKRLHLNIRTKQDVKWIQHHVWQRNSGTSSLAPVIPIVPGSDLEALRGRECFGGLDLSSTTDLTAFALVFPFPEKVYKIVVWYWVPGEIPEEKERRDKVPYMTWSRGGWIEACGQKVIDYNQVQAKIQQILQVFDVREIAFDPYNAQQMANALEDQVPMIKFPQTKKNYTEVCKEFERLLLLGKIDHGENPVLAWNASNVALDYTGPDAMMPSKKKSSEKIDGLVASLMAFARAILTPPKKISRYRTRGMA